MASRRRQSSRPCGSQPSCMLSPQRSTARGRSPPEPERIFSAYIHLRHQEEKAMEGLNIDIGIGQEDRRKIADGLSRLLADTYTLYLKTHNFHWNVEGPMFNTLHLMFEQQYTELATAVDLIAE